MGIVIVFILLLCLGVSVSFLATMALALIGIIVIAMDVFFIYATIIMLKGEKKAGRFIRSEQSGKSKIPYAIYEIDGAEYRNLLPLEVLLRNKIYNPEKNVSLILNEKKKCCFDNNARICCILGIVVSSFLIFEMAVLVIRNVLL